MSEWLRSKRGDYIERCQRLADAPLTDAERVAFVLMTPRQPYERAVAQWRAWRRTGRVEGSLAPSRRRYIHAASTYDGLIGLKRASWEDGRLWALRLAASIPGLGIVKAPFACCMMEPLAQDVPVCMDIWMYRALEFNEDVGSRSRNEGAQRLLLTLAEMARMPPFPAQWAIWDWKRAAGAQVAPLVEPRMTDIANDLMGGAGKTPDSEVPCWACKGTGKETK